MFIKQIALQVDLRLVISLLLIQKKEAGKNYFYFMVEYITWLYLWRWWFFSLLYSTTSLWSFGSPSGPVETCPWEFCLTIVPPLCPQNSFVLCSHSLDIYPACLFSVPLNLPKCYIFIISLLLSLSVFFAASLHPRPPSPSYFCSCVLSVPLKPVNFLNQWGWICLLYKWQQH